MGVCNSHNVWIAAEPLKFGRGDPQIVLFSYNMIMMIIQDILVCITVLTLLSR